MTFLPILERELRSRARRPGAYWGRFTAGLVGIVICMFVSSSEASSPILTGKHLFEGVAAVAFVLSCGACLLSADVVSSERREGTLGLLLLTRVKPMDILLGKLGSAGLASLSALLAFLPILMIPVLAGGVTGGEAARTGLALLNTMFFALSIGLSRSVCSEGKAKAITEAVALVVLFSLLPMLIEPIGIGSPSPTSSLYRAGDRAYRAGPWSYWTSLAMVQCLGWLFLWSARTALQRRPVLDESLPAQTAEARSFVLTDVPPSFRWQNVQSAFPPIQWLVQRERGFNTAIWAGALLGALYQTSMISVAPYRGQGTLGSSLSVAQLPEIAVSVVGGGFFAWAASRFFVQARRTGELELLLTTPAGAATILSDQWKAWKTNLRLPLLLILFPLLVRLGSFMGKGDTGLSLPWYLASSSLSVANMVFGLAAFCSLGLWFGLKAPGQGAAVLRAVGVCIAPPFLFSLAGMGLFWAILRHKIFSGQSFLLACSIRLPQFAMLAVYGVCFWLINRKLTSEFAGAEPVQFNLRDLLPAAMRKAPTASRPLFHPLPR